jgi:2,3-bisphosphoglycerate-independent phosphoglycerate mutase
MTPTPPPTVLVIRDGWGTNPHPEHNHFNAVHLAHTPVADRLAENVPSALLRTSGEDVGLPTTPEGPVMGNSEVGHQNIGAGRIVDQELQRITRAIESGAFFENAALDAAFGHIEGTGGSVHLLGLASDGKVHSDLAHVNALIDAARRRGVPRERFVVHAFTDGRDTPPQSGRGFVSALNQSLASFGYAPVASIIGRYWAMDRDNRWDRIALAYACLVGPADHVEPTAEEAFDHAYAHPPTPSQRGDEFIPPLAIAANDRDAVRTRIADGDSIIFFNFRGDRPRELARAFVLSDEALASQPNGGFRRSKRLSNLRFTGLTQYEATLPIDVIFEKTEPMEAILGSCLAAAGRTQFRCAETEKYPHVTFFFNDYREEPFAGEQRTIIQSPMDVATYDLKPSMSAAGVRDSVCGRLAAEDCEDLIVVNFANGDMVGHTGVLDAAVAACECVDACVGDILSAAAAQDATVLVTADHGNAEQMWDPVAECPHTAHTNFTVPLHLVGERFRGASLRSGGRLADLAPTILSIMEVESPSHMTGRALHINR